MGQQGEMSIVFIGDIHRDWRPIALGLDRLDTLPKAAVLMGDIECTAPLDELARPLLDRGIAVHWISGNHDNDGGRDMWDNLSDPARNPITAGGALHGRVVDIAGVRVAGLSGIFRPRVWDARRAPSLRRRADLPADLAKLGPSLRAEHVAALTHSLSTIAIWHEDVEALAAMRADVLVVHDAPCSHRDGHAVLTDLARRMGAAVVLHGHHHVSYVADSEAGDLRAIGVGASWGLGLDGRVLWRGEPPRILGPQSADWRLLVEHP